MTDNTHELRSILEEFLHEWPLERVENMTLGEYVSTRDHDTFCYWVELMAIELGNIRGYQSMKFGIYKRDNPNKSPKGMISDEFYSWQKYYGNNRDEAFAKVKSEIVQIIKYAKNDDFEKIDNFKLNPLFRWKIAFLYSGERLVPIYKRSVLVDIAQGFANQTSKKTSYSSIYQKIIDNKPTGMSVYTYARQLYKKYVLDDKNESTKKSGKRKGTTNKNTKNQVRKGTKDTVVSQEHNQLQNKLYDYLLKKHGGEKYVKMEKDHVDIQVVLHDEIILYEVKSDKFADNCIKAALGQLITYNFANKENIKKSLIVAGKNPANKDEKMYIKYLQKLLNIDFSYVSIDQLN